jgi:peptidoglycan hydrolase CwlO-like protein
MVAARPRTTTVIVYVDNADAKKELISVLQEKLKESESKCMDLQFKILAGKIETVAKDLSGKIDATNDRIDAMVKDLNGKIDATNDRIDVVAKHLVKIQLGLVVIAWLSLIQTLPSILTFFR